ncbi:MAG: YihY/virulence factor BrkB family protein [Lachnospiraceae bacterium]|nr:YihY/virulence factor BrkB family protein [Lachnospiraceae bacterium]
MKHIIAAIHYIQKFIDKITKDAVSAYVAQTAFFIVLSFVPFLIFLLTLVHHLPISKDALLAFVSSALPHEIDNFIVSIINEMYSSSSATLLSVSVIAAIWSASRGFLSIYTGFNAVYNTKESRNYFLLRLISSIYTVIFAVILLAMLSLMVFGNQLFLALVSHIPNFENTALLIISMRVTVAAVILYIFFLFLYIFLPKRDEKTTLLAETPGAIIASAGWILLSYLYSLYIDHFANLTMYGSLTILIFLMLWLYMCVYLIFIGAEINVFFQATNFFARLKAYKPLRKLLHRS